MKSFFICTICVLLFAIPCHAETGFNTEIDVSLATVSSTTDSTFFLAAFKLSGDTSYFSGNFRYSEVDKATVEEKGYLRCGYDPEINDWLSLWFFEEVGYNNKIGLEFENYIGGGPKFRTRLKDVGTASISVGFLCHHSRFSGSSRVERVRASLSGKLFLRSGAMEFALISFYQPDVENLDDYILTGETSLRYALNDVVGLKFTIEDEYRSAMDENELITTLSLSVRM